MNLSVLFVLFVLSVVNPTDVERANVLQLAHGATVISRTGELLLQTSALHAIDGDEGTFWMNPPNDLPQSMTIELPSRTRVDKIGVRTEANGAFTANHLTFSASTDGRTFAPVKTIQAKDSNDVQWFDVKPFEATQIRVSIVTVFITVLIGVLKIFDIIFVMTGGQFNTNVIGVEFYNQINTFQNQGYAAAIVVILLVAVSPVMYYQVRQFRAQEAMR